ncbi:hypothetical protein ACFQRB_04850 [Halobaculum litoreum]|uniref:CDP-Glycerol:Poly(Glycerophosphate) glycerophosphotransferase n=2 Tax=Halobaculum litoreum TaxID=3031998 RepID=A0ABD5XSM3_9EURY
MANEALHTRRTTLGLYRRLLRRIEPELVVVVVSYFRDTFIEACQRESIPVAELQHGLIFDHHFGYSYRGSRTKRVFPDYVLTFGDYWSQGIEYPIPDDHVISVGYPYLEEAIREYETGASTNQILFISQGTIGEDLSRLAVEVASHPDMGYDVVYKLHPGEYERWTEEYPWLADADLEVIDSSEPQLYSLFAESAAQVGVGSTAVFEGLAFDLETYIYDRPGSEALAPLAQNGAARMVSSADELVSSLGEETEPFDREYYFEPGAAENVCAVIDRLRTGE